jgi:Holliday junction resolvase RusA-like endonuclease
MIRFVIPGVPVAKGRARIGRTSKGQPVAYTPGKTRSYEALVKLAAQQAMAGRVPFGKEVGLFLRVDAYLPVPQSWSRKKRQAALDGAVRPSSRPDLDNFVKAALDGLNGILFADDSSVVQIWAAKMYGDVPRLVVEAAAI